MLKFIIMIEQKIITDELKKSPSIRTNKKTITDELKKKSQHIRENKIATFMNESVVYNSKKNSVSFELSVASGTTRLVQSFWWAYYETLDVMGVDTKYLDDGYGVVLRYHDRKDHVGNITNVRVDPKNEKIYATLEFYLDVAESRSVFERVRNGLYRNVSIGYYAKDGADALEVKELEDDDNDNDVNYEVIFRDWVLAEVSFVPVPADATVGVGRSKNSSMEEKQMSNPVEQEVIETSQEKEGLSEKIEVSPEKVKDNERNLDTILDGFRGLIDSSRLSFDEFRERLITVHNGSRITERDVAKELVTLERSKSGSDVEKLSTVNVVRNETEFSCGKILQNYIRGVPQDGEERELLDEFTRKTESYAPLTSSMGGIIIPHAAFARDRSMSKLLDMRAVDVAATPAGYHHEMFDETNFVDALVSKAYLLPEITILPDNLVQDLVGVVESGAWTVSHTDQDDAITESTGVTFGNRTFKWHQINARVKVRKRSLDQSTLLMGRIMQQAQRDIARGVDNVILNGTGSSAQPTGIFALAGLDSVDGGAAANANIKPSYKLMVDLRTELYKNNAEHMEACYVLTPETYGTLQVSSRLTGATGSAADAIVQVGPDKTKMIDGYKLIVTNHLRKNANRGTTTGKSHYGLFGNLKEMEMGMFQGVEFFMDPYSESANSLINLYVRQAYDILPRHVASFAAILNLDPAL